MWEQLLPQLFSVFAPIVADIIKSHREQTGHDPTPAEMDAIFLANISKYLGEGDLWKAAHPNV